MVTLAEDMVVADRFRLVRKIGRGGMGSVWRAIHLGLDTPCAVKFIEGEHTDVADAHARFEREAKAAAQLRSPNVVQIFDHGVWQGHPYIAMELLEGDDLGKHLAEHGGRLPAAEVCFVVQQVCRALSRAHQAGVVHRDLKPDNIFVVRDDDRDVVKILDFGIAKSATSVSGGGTKTGALLGTPYYMSPEQAQGTKAVDARSDLWSLAVIVFQCLTGRLPFESEALGDLLLKIMVAPLPTPSEVFPAVPAGFDAWWQTAADRDPEKRYPTAKAFAESLGLALGQSSSATEVKELSRLHGGSSDQSSRANPTVLTPLSAKTPAVQPSRPPPVVAVEVMRVISGDEDVKALVQGLNEGIVGGLAQNTSIAVRTGDAAGADFVLKGSVQAVGKRLRISFVLEEVASSEHLWAERYDRQLDDVFGLQDEIIRLLAAAVRTRIKIRLFSALADADDATLAFPQLLDKAAGLFHQPSVETIRKALVTLRCALERAPDNSMASAMMGFGLYNVAERDPLALTPEATQEILTFLDRAVTLDPRSYVARAFSAIAVHDLRGDHRRAHELANEALSRNATFIAAQGMVAICDIHLGRVAEGTRRLQEVMATSLDDASHSRHRRELAIAHWLNGDAAEGARVAAKLRQETPEIQRNAVVLAGLSAAAGELEDARREIEALKAAVPGITLATARLPRIGDAAAAARFRDALVEAGL